ncbi:MULTISPECIES: SpoIIE family protein phosphatase [unclassified Ruminococcus]|uniref:SpoIIE family protein phosphatase n=1 Tax=unclassified Ruminococcus TaxID=2608920 RepID=UPI00210AF79A|nr:MULTISPECIES: SpoIIE family protein phosphatase [unclassified Ruminococcus]MCQ4021687.1 SpoIIE family protein phosphatase [Ruminococcus sp. zg-924]MCQ4114132.1 SpoIIE family protein phosphatase [Ruminococcus sp. zg-921]
MRNSISFKILVIIALVLILTDVCLLILGFHSVYTSVHNNYISYAKSSATLASDILEGADMQRLLTDEAYAKPYSNTLSDLCEANDLEYLYVYIPDTEKNTITYVILICNDYSSSLATTERSAGTTIEHSLNPAELSALNGDTSNNITETNNRYGSVITYSSAVCDLNGNVTALVGADVSADKTLNVFIERYSILFIVILISFVFVIIIIAVILKTKLLKPAEIISNRMKCYVTDRQSGFKKLEVKGKDEFANMADSFNYMADEIDNYIKNINALTEEKHLRDAEMSIAKDIQCGLLPDNSYKNKNITISAVMIPAKEVGGDFYDYFNLKEDKICTVIADVSGKGISAAIFMSRAITVIRQYAQMGYSPSEILFRTNNCLSLNNPEQMFITAFVGVYDAKTQIFTYANAGHTIPYLISNTIKTLDNPDGMAAGIFENEKYEESSIRLKTGDTVFMFTDGISEAVNKDKEFFGTKRIENILKNYTTKKNNSCIDLVLGEVKAYATGTAQSDDITMLSFSPCKTSEIILKAETENLLDIRSLIMDTQDIPNYLKNKLYLAAEEIFVNICSYANDNNSGSVKFSLEVSDKIIMSFYDDGKKFNPIHNNADINSYDIDSQIGGLGIYLALSIADEANYEYKNNKNILTLIKYFQEE